MIWISVVRLIFHSLNPIQAYPEDGITAALSNVLDFEQQQGDIWDMVVSILHKHGIPFGARPISNVSPRWGLCDDDVLTCLHTCSYSDQIIKRFLSKKLIFARSRIFQQIYGDLRWLILSFLLLVFYILYLVVHGFPCFIKSRGRQIARVTPRS